MKIHAREEKFYEFLDVGISSTRARQYWLWLLEGSTVNVSGYKMKLNTAMSHILCWRNK